MCRKSPGACCRYRAVGQVEQLQQCRSAEFAAAMSYTGGPGRVGGRAPDGKGRGRASAVPFLPAPLPGPGHCSLLRSQNGAAGRCPQVRAPRRLSSVYTLAFRLLAASDLGFCRPCPRVPASVLEVYPPNLSTPAWLPRTSMPQVALSQVSAIDQSAGSAFVAIAAPSPAQRLNKMPQLPSPRACPGLGDAPASWATSKYLGDLG